MLLLTSMAATSASSRIVMHCARAAHGSRTERFDNLLSAKTLLEQLLERVDLTIGQVERSEQEISRRPASPEEQPL